MLLRELVLALGQKLPESAGNAPWIREPRWLFHINIVAMDALAILFLLIQGPGFGVDLFILPAELLVVGLALASLLRDAGVDVVRVPWALLGLFVLGAALAGVLAAVGPARRAARASVIDSIAVE